MNTNLKLNVLLDERLCFEHFHDEKFKNPFYNIFILQFVQTLMININIIMIKLNIYVISNFSKKMDLTSSFKFLQIL